MGTFYCVVLYESEKEKGIFFTRRKAHQWQTSWAWSNLMRRPSRSVR